jgi:hypothetical protein
MKKVFVLLAAVAITTSAWAKHVTGPDVSEKVLSAFAKEFTGAANANWTAKEDVYIVTFTLNNERVRAWFNNEGNMEAVQRDIHADQMTLLAAQAVLELAASETILSISELSDNGTLYYVVKTENTSHKKTYNISVNGSVSKAGKKRK